MREAQFELHAQIEDRHWWFAGRRAIIKRLMEHVLPPDPEALVIDVGCGTGANIAALRQSYRCLGVDQSAHAIDLARARFSGVEYACHADIAASAEPLRAASAVLLTDVLEHAEDDFALLSQIVALLRPGAYVLITVPADPSLWSVHDESFGHWRRYETERLRATWRGLPVEERLLSPYNSRLFPVIKLVRAISRVRARPSGAAGTDFKMPSGPTNGWLEWFFAGEGDALERSLDRGKPSYARGASLIAILRRLEGAITPREKPPGLLPDHWKPI